MRSNSKTKGDTTEAAILAALIKKGLSVSIPFGDNQRYDLIVDYGDRLVRVQCKTGRLRNGVICFNAYSQNHDGSVRNSYFGEADLFMVYCEELDQVYCIPVDSAPTTGCSLRVTPSKNKQESNIRYAINYML